MSIEEYFKMDLEDVLRILEEDYTIVETTVDYVGIELNDGEKITIPLDLWTQAIMINGLTGELA